MRGAYLIFLTVIGILNLSCGSVGNAPEPRPEVPGKMAKQMVAERMAAVIVTHKNELKAARQGKFAVLNAPDDSDGGSAAPITEDGYFLTADHVLSRSSGKNTFVIFSRAGRLQSEKARIVWRSEADDLALLHISQGTPYFYNWSDPKAWASPGRPVIHGGMSTGFRSPPGKLRTAIPPETNFSGNRKFRIDIPLRPGDSGGPVVDAWGNLIGINSAVEFLVPLETAIFIDSEGNRPNTRKITKIINADRKARQTR